MSRLAPSNPCQDRTFGAQGAVVPQEPLPLAQGRADALYVHVPFCDHRCGYCNFAVWVGSKELEPALNRAWEQEARWTLPGRLTTVYFGGGTPSRLSLPAMERLLKLVHQHFDLVPECEWTVEANPQDVTPQWLELLREHGVTRISLGAQSFLPQKLQALDRRHQVEHIWRAVELVQQAGLVLSLDLIFAAPGESLAQWVQDLHCAIRTGAEHFSVYGLTIERGTRFWSLRRRGLLQEVPEELQAQMYETTLDHLAQAGWQHYEVSNFARPGFQCQHNLKYWHAKDYHASGPGAARHYQGIRQTNHPSTTTYLKRVLGGRSPVWHSERLSWETRRREALVLGLRTTAGVHPEEFAARWGATPQELAPQALENFLRQGLLTWHQGRLRLTRRGLLVSDSIWGELLDEEG